MRTMVNASYNVFVPCLDTELPVRGSGVGGTHGMPLKHKPLFHCPQCLKFVKMQLTTTRQSQKVK